jgi:WD40 repeat protein
LDAHVVICTIVGDSDCSASGVSLDGKHVVAVYDNSEFRVWNVIQRKATWTMHDLEGWFTEMVLTSNLEYVVTGSARYPYLKIWDFNREEIRSMAGHRGHVTSLSISLDNKHVLSGSTDQTLRLWELTTGRQIAVFGTDSEIVLCSTSPDPLTFVAVEKSGRLHYLRLVQMENPDCN